MKKKILLTLTIISLIVVVFALSVSASNYVVTDDFEYFEYGNTYTYVSSTGGSTLDYTFGFLDIRNDASDTIGFGIIEIENFHRYLTERNVTNADELVHAFDNSVEIGELALEDRENYLTTVYNVVANTDGVLYVWDVYTRWLSEKNAPTYEDGLKDGVDNYKQSEAFQIRLEMEKDLGRSEGKADFISSDEYQTLLDEEYDKGFSDGAAEDGGSVVGTTVTSILGVGVLLIVLLTVVNAISSKKRKKR